MEREERLVVVTGAGKGIGTATMHALLTDPSIRVIAVGRDLGRLELSATEESRCERCELDLLGMDAVARIKSQVGRRRVHGLLHNAGVLDATPMGQHQRTNLERLFAINVFVPLELSQALAPELSGDPPGHIVHVGSMGGFQDAAKFPGLVGYSSSKAALACMAQCLAEEFKGSGIRSNCLAIGAVDTDMLRTAFPGFTAPVGPADMGAYIAEFILNGHKLFNGKVLPVAVSTP
ncbi:MAG: SDR family oxidoreductase [Flavobacteriales bacterium]|nr:SDR family oxidoreductase [Flavobacteriales bacterium]